MTLIYLAILTCGKKIDWKDKTCVEQSQYLDFDRQLKNRLVKLLADDWHH